MQVHQRLHSGDRPYRCGYKGCGKAFATSYGVKSHRRVHTGEKPYECTGVGCTKAFKTSGDLQKHIRTHTGLLALFHLLGGPCAGSGVVRIDPLRFLAGYHKKRLNQALSVLSVSLGFL